MVRFTKRYKYSRMNGGKKKRRKTQKNKRRKHRKGGMTFGKQKPLSPENKPNRGDKVRVKNGYGRNFLLKQGKALRFNKENLEEEQLDCIMMLIYLIL